MGHFDLLQNADDACATNARFILEENRLIFAHNGTRHFFVSNPANEDIDSERKTLGDINAITSIANSNKTGASIGKFGVGFKAVFQYTSTPHIYDPSFKFKIERFIVPIKLDTDFPGRRADETLFVFPFDHQERDAEEAYNDISDKLKNLSFPLLFLTNLKGIEFEFGNVLGLYDKRIKQTITYENTTAEHIVLTQNDGDELYDEELWLFSRLDECERRYSVGFFMDEKGHLCPVNKPAFCFFPTKEVTNLNFILHAPFLLTDSREGIRAGVAHNDKLIRRLAELSADALVHLRDIGIDTSTKLIDDNIVDIIPTDEAVFSDPADKRKVSFLPFFEEIKGKLKSCAIIPSVDGYVESENAYWAAVPQLTQLFSNEQLSDITENANAQWVFVTLGRDEVQRNNKASMIPLANIVYPLYKKTPKRFIIAGDPFQIEPITSVDLWKNENIYTMVHLDSFVKLETIPYQYKVELLTTQYRSVPDIGGIFSNFAYGGILKHNRSVESQRPLNVGNDLGIETLNIIKFPVSKYESIYRCKRLQHSSSYQVYSAIFTFEYVSYLSRAIAKNNPGELFKIGVIAPYRAQADMIDKLLASEKLPKEVDVQVGTIHGFQGDECDIIFAVFNTPPTISASKDMFLNKRNIINVSISRARDYLFVVMPDDDTDNISNLRLVKRVESLIQSTDAWNEFLTPDLEELMFGDAKYLENNAFSTSHQSVNVYGLPEKIYEVRTEDTAVDVQIHRSTSKKEEVDPTLASGTVVVDEPQYMDSYDLDESLIPEELRDTAIDLPVRGAINGWCYLVPYEGKLKSHTVKKVIGMFIPQNRNGQEKMVSVSVVKEDRIIYISKDMFKIYEQSLSEPDGIQLKRTFF